MNLRFRKFFQGESVPFRGRVIPTRPLGFGVGVTSEPTLIESIEKLQTFLDSAKHGWQWGSNSIDELLEDYNQAYFHGHVLICGAVSATSGSTQVVVNDVLQTEADLTIMIDMIFPNIGTADMMSWHYFVEIASEEVGERSLKINLPISNGGSHRGGHGFVIADR